MKDFKKLVKLLGAIKKSSKQIVVKSLVIMKKLSSEDSYLVDDLVDAVGSGKITKVDALELLQNTVTEWTVDAAEILKEIDKFITGDQDSFKINPICEFLYEVWNGDMYGKMENTGMEELLRELTLTLEQIDEENLVQTAAKKFVPKKKDDAPLEVANNVSEETTMPEKESVD